MKLTRIIICLALCLSLLASCGGNEGEPSSVAEERFEVSETPETSEFVDYDYDKLLAEIAKSLNVPSSTKTDITLEKSVTYQDAIWASTSFETEISWSSDNEDVITSDGKVTRPEKDTTVKLVAKLKYEDHEVEKSFRVKVPAVTPDEQYEGIPVYTGAVNGEKSPEKLDEFAGAIHHKVASSYDSWLGIETVVTLPVFTGDEKRTGAGQYGVKTRYLDNPSVYLGSEAKYITDVGLTLSPVRDPANKSAIYPDGHKAFRPFWRYQPGNNYANSNVGDYCYYYYPGDTVRMSLYVTRPGYLQLKIELLEETAIEEYASFRKSYGMGENYSKVFISPEFPSEGVGATATRFRHVNALDQVSNEGKPTQKTNASSVGTAWKEVYLYRNIDGTIYKVPMTSERCSVIDAPTAWKDAFVYSYDGVDKVNGGEVVTLDPKNN